MPVEHALLKFLDHAYALAEAERGQVEDFEGLIAEAEGVIAALNKEHGLLSDDAAPLLTIQAHLSRIDRMTVAPEDEVTPSLPPARLFLRGPRRSVLMNEDAATLLGTPDAQELADLPFQPASEPRIAARLTGQTTARQKIVLHENGAERSFLGHIERLDPETHLIALEEVDWAPILAHVPATPKLSPAERTLLGHLIRGASQRDAALRLSKSTETVKSQAKSILRKCAAERIQDIVQIAEDLACAGRSGAHTREPSGPNAFEICAPPNGRTVSYRRYGARGGRALLFVHGLIQGPFFSESMDCAFEKAGFDVIAPCRPGFGRTDAAEPRADFDGFSTDDAIGLLAELGVRDAIVVAHQGGVSHACRIASDLGPRCAYLLMVGAGIPIDDKRHLKGMNRQTQVGAIGARYTPRLLETMLRVGFRTWGDNYAGYLRHYFGKDSEDAQTLSDPIIGPLQIAGVRHMSEAGPQAVLDDGKAALANWLPDYQSVSCPIGWIHAKTDPIMRYSYVEEFVARENGEMLRLFETGGNCMLYVHFEEILEIIQKIAADHPPG